MRPSEIARLALAVMLTAAASPGQDGWVVQGRQDAVAPPANGEMLKKAYPGRVTLVELN